MLRRSEVELKTYKALANMDEQLIRTIYTLVDDYLQFAKRRNARRKADGLSPIAVNEKYLRIKMMITNRNTRKSELCDQGDPDSVPLDAFGKRGD